MAELKKNRNSWSIYLKLNIVLIAGFSLFAFTAIIDLIISLEMPGTITGFMSWYLDNGEPYLVCSWGYMSCAWDAAVFYFMYIVLCHYSSNG